MELVCKELKMPDMSGHLISLFSSLRLFAERDEEFSLCESSEAVDVDEFLRAGTSIVD